MNDSSCVQCGECATACPTGALVFRRRVAPKNWQSEDGSPVKVPESFREPLPDGLLSVEEMLKVELSYLDREKGVESTFRPFDNIPFAFLKWNEGAVRKRTLKEGEYLCH